MTWVVLSHSSFVINQKTMSLKTAEQIAEGYDLSGKTILLTGCNTGIGYETMRVLSSKGARIIALARTEEKARNAAEKVGGDILPLACEMSDFSSLQNCVAQINEPIDVIIANAGIMAIQERTLYHGYESQFFVNHVAHFYLVNKLLPLLTENGRVIAVSSGAHARARHIQFEDLSFENSYTPWGAYGQSKLANILFVKGLTKRLKPGQTANALHPGVISSDLWRHLPPEEVTYTMTTVDYGAATSVYLTVSEEVSGISGEYFKDCAIGEPTAVSQDPEMADTLWGVTESIIWNLENSASSQS